MSVSLRFFKKNFIILLGSPLAIFHDLTFSNLHILFYNIDRQLPRKYENMKYMISN